MNNYKGSLYYKAEYLKADRNKEDQKVEFDRKWRFTYPKK